MKRFNSVIIVSILALLVAGIIGCNKDDGDTNTAPVASFTIAQRTKEIGIRKSCGASAYQIIKLLVREYIRYVLYANVIACPIAYYLVFVWLQNFAQRISVGILPFLIAGGIAFCITIFAISWQVLKASTANPVEALRYE